MLYFRNLLSRLQAGFLVAQKDFGDVEKMTPEDRNELLRTNKDVLLVHLESEYDHSAQPQASETAPLNSTSPGHCRRFRTCRKC